MNRIIFMALLTVPPAGASAFLGAGGGIGGEGTTCSAPGDCTKVVYSPDPSQAVRIGDTLFYSFDFPNGDGHIGGNVTAKASYGDLSITGYAHGSATTGLVYGGASGIAMFRDTMTINGGQGTGYLHWWVQHDFVNGSYVPLLPTTFEYGVPFDFGIWIDAHDSFESICNCALLGFRAKVWGLAVFTIPDPDVPGDPIVTGLTYSTASGAPYGFNGATHAPEPGYFLLSGCGLAAMLWWRRARTARQSGRGYWSQGSTRDLP